MDHYKRDSSHPLGNGRIYRLSDLVDDHLKAAWSGLQVCQPQHEDSSFEIQVHGCLYNRGAMTCFAII